MWRLNFLTFALPFLIIISATIFLFYVVHSVYKHIVAPKIREKKVEKAKQLGHVVDATLFKTVKKEGKDHNTEYKIVYKYKYQKRTYRYKFFGTATQPEKITLYFKRFPRFAVSEYDITDLGYEKIIIFAVCLCFCTALWFIIAATLNIHF